MKKRNKPIPQGEGELKRDYEKEEEEDNG